MRAVRFERDGTARFVHVPNPQPGPEDVLVQVLAAGVCHTDLHLPDEVTADNYDPLIPRHEIAGRAAADRSGVAVGQAGEGDLAVVIGAGGVGLSAIQIAKVHGARVLAVDVREEARKAALDSGADLAVPPDRAASAVREIAGAQGADVSIDFVGTKAR